MRVLVVGATGFVASRLVPALAASGHDVIAAGHDRARLERLSGGAAIAEIDLRRVGWRSGLPRRVDAVIQLAQANVGFPDGARDLFAVNVAATQELLEYARATGAERFVLASSGSVYGSGVRLRETDPTPACGYYAATKLAAERLALAHADVFSVLVFRLFTPYGSGQTSRLVPRLVDAVAEGRAIRIHPTGGPFLTPVHVDDVVLAFVRSLTAASEGVLNLAGDETLSMQGMAVAIGEGIGAVPLFEIDASRNAVDLAGDTERLHAELDLPALIPFGRGVRELVSRARDVERSASELA